LNNSLLERYSLFTTLVNRALADLPHHVFSAAAGELTNLINFLVVVRFFFLLLLSFFLPLTSWVLALLCEEPKVLVNSFPRLKGICIRERERHKIISLWLNALLKSMRHLLQMSHMLLLCTQWLRVTTLRLSLHYLTWCSKISFLDHPLRIQICISQLS